MMIAIFRANPAAFQNNLNRLHTGVTLHFPSSEQLAAIPAEEANREYDAQMAAWRTASHRLAPATPAAPAAPAVPTAASTSASAPANSGAPNSSGDTPANTDSQETDRVVLTQRVATLEKSLDQLRQELKQPLVVQKTMPMPMPVTVPVAAAPALQAASGSEDDIDDEDEPAPHHGLRLASIAAGIALSLVAGASFYRRRRTVLNPAAPRAQTDTVEVESVPAAETAAPPLKTILGTALPGEKAPREPQKADSKAGHNESSWFEDSFSTPIAELLANDPMESPSTDSPSTASPGRVSPSTVSASRPTVSAASEQTAELPVETTVKLPAATPVIDGDTTMTLAAAFEVVGDTVEQKFSFFNPESANNTEHVVMGSGLEAPRPFVERRKNPADVLRQAIEREPERSDLRLKLLELYYTAAADNRRAFLDATRQLAKNEKLASAEDWSRIADMGRTIAPDDELFSADLDDKRVA
jgi:pilus assembly protein FimV